MPLPFAEKHYELTLNLIERTARYIDARDKGEKTFGGCKYRTNGNARRETTGLICC